MQISIDKIMSFGPCDAWPRERMLQVTGGREEFDTSELSGFDVPTEDLIWLTINILQSLGNRDEYMLKAAFAERVLPLYEREYPDDLRPRLAIRAARMYALSKIDESELAAASDAARAAARDAARAAAWDAASDAASAAASAVAWYAAWYAARTEAWYAARAEERRAQREICALFLKNI